MVDTGGEVDLGRLERVVGGEVDGKEEDTAGVGRVTLEVIHVSKLSTSEGAETRSREEGKQGLVVRGPRHHALILARRARESREKPPQAVLPSGSP